MKHRPHRPPSPARPAPAASPNPDRAHWTPAKQRAFLHALAETGSVARSARAVGMSRSSAHRLRARLAGTPFDRVWGTVLRLHAEQLANPFGADAAARSPDGDGAAPVAQR